MGDHGIKRNGAGYYDPTAYKAIKGLHSCGEIWMQGAKEVLIVKNQGTFCNVLQLVPDMKPGTVPVNTKDGIRFTNPAMLKYAFNLLLGPYVSDLSDEESRSIVRQVEKAICREERMEDE